MNLHDEAKLAYLLNQVFMANVLVVSYKLSKLEYNADKVKNIMVGILGTNTSISNRTGITSLQKDNIFLNIFNLDSLNWINDNSNIINDISYTFTTQDYNALLKDRYNKFLWVENIHNDRMMVFGINFDIYGLALYLLNDTDKYRSE